MVVLSKPGRVVGEIVEIFQKYRSTQQQLQQQQPVGWVRVRESAASAHTFREEAYPVARYIYVGSPALICVDLLSSNSGSFAHDVQAAIEAERE